MKKLKVVLTVVCLHENHKSKKTVEAAVKKDLLLSSKYFII